MMSVNKQPSLLWRSRSTTAALTTVRTELAKLALPSLEFLQSCVFVGRRAHAFFLTTYDRYNLAECLIEFGEGTVQCEGVSYY